MVLAALGRTADGIAACATRDDAGTGRETLAGTMAELIAECPARRVAAQRAQDAPAKALRRRRRVARVALALAPSVLATVHPLSLLRGHPVTREAEIERFVADLKQAADALG